MVWGSRRGEGQGAGTQKENGGGGRERHPRRCGFLGTRGNHFSVSTGDFRVPVETVQRIVPKSDVETIANRHPWKPYHRMFVQRGTRGNRSDVGTNAMGIRGNQKILPTAAQVR